MNSLDHVSFIRATVARALDLPELEFDVTVPEAQFGDYATNAALIAGKQLKANPLSVAEALAGKLQADAAVRAVFDLIEAVKPGFINFRLSEKSLLENLQTIVAQPDSYGSAQTGQGKLALVEYFQLNVAKPPHIGHIRSAVIGDSLKRVLISQGYRAVSDTHIGDWGTQFGILLWGYKTLDGRTFMLGYEQDPLEGFLKLYVEANKRIEEDPGLREQAKLEFVRLEQGDAENRKLWQYFISISKKEFDGFTQALGLLPFDYDLGESFYESRMKDIVERLDTAGLLTVGETGERYVDLEAYKLGRLICIKSDGGTTYELRDLATVAYRYDELAKKEGSSLDRNLYVVDARQAHDFKQVFKTMELLGYDMSKSRHVEFGYLSLPEGAMSTRKGTVIRLGLLLAEARSRALHIINEKNPGLENKEAVANMVALAALKYEDLSSNRKSDVIFDWDKALSFEGDTGPYLQYTHARLKSILRKSNELKMELRDSYVLSAEEKDLLRYLVQFPRIVAMTADNLLPNTVAHYLYELSSLVNRFYQAVPVLQEEDQDLRCFRLALVSASATVLKNGLYLLGIEAPEQM